MRLRALTLLAAVVLTPAVTRAQEGASPPAVAPFPEIAEGYARAVVGVRTEPAVTDEDPWALVGLRPQDRPTLTTELAQTVLRRALASGTFLEASLSVRRALNGVELVLRGERRWSLGSYELRGIAARPYAEVDQELGLRRGAAKSPCASCTS